MVTHTLDRIPSNQMAWMANVAARIDLGGFDDLSSPVQEKVLYTEERSAAEGLPVRFMFSGIPFNEVVVTPGQAGRAWAFSSLAKDPLWAHPQGYPIPQAVKAEVLRIADANLPLSELYIAHEYVLPALWEQGENGPTAPTLEMLTPPPAPQAQTRAAGVGALAGGLLGAAAAPLLGLGLGLALTAAALPMALAVAVDPILFSIVRPQPGTRLSQRVAFMYLAHWQYG